MVRKLLLELKRGEAGVALPMVLVLLMLGSLLIIPSLNYVATSLKAGEIHEKNIKGLYAADAGVVVLKVGVVIEEYFFPCLQRRQ